MGNRVEFYRKIGLLRISCQKHRSVVGNSVGMFVRLVGCVCFLFTFCSCTSEVKHIFYGTKEFEKKEQLMKLSLSDSSDLVKARIANGEKPDFYVTVIIFKDRFYFLSQRVKSGYLFSGWMVTQDGLVKPVESMEVLKPPKGVSFDQIRYRYFRE